MLFPSYIDLSILLNEFNYTNKFNIIFDIIVNNNFDIKTIKQLKKNFIILIICHK